MRKLKRKKGLMTLTPRANVMKHFTAVIYKWAKEARVFVLGEPFHPSLVFVRKAKFLRSRP
jgi:hypothetical protein